MSDVLSSPRRLDAVWLVLPTTIALLAFGLVPLRSWDYWWHITMGRLVNYWGAVPAQNHFLYTLPADAPSYDQPWLAQLLLYLGHETGSVHLSLLFRNVVGTAIVAVLGYASMRRSRSTVVGSLATLAALPFLIAYLEVRPHLFVAPLFVLLLFVGLAVRHRAWSLFWLLLFPGTTALWANLHGSFPIPGLLAAAFAGGALVDGWREENDVPSTRGVAWLGAAASTPLAALANPRGADIYGYLYDVSTNPTIQQTVSEWFPTTPGSPAVLGTLFYVVVVVGLVALVRAREELDPTDTLLFVGFALLGAYQNRSLVWFALSLPVALGPYLGMLGRPDADRERPTSGAQHLHTAAVVALVVVPIVVQPIWQWRVNFTADSEAFDVRRRRPLRGVVPEETPFEAVDLLSRYADPPRLFHDHRFAGFVLYHLTDEDPRQLVFVDHRVELPPRRIWKLYETASHGADNWERIVDEWDVGGALLSTENQAKLVEHLDQSPDWTSVARTETWVYFDRTSGDHQ